MTTRILKSILTAMLISNLFSCATILHGNKNAKTISITGTPEGAKIYANDKEIGRSPLSYTPPKTKNQSIKIVKEGFKDQLVPIPTKLDPLWTGISIVGGAVGLFIPTIIDFKNGSVRKVKLDKLNYSLDSIYQGVTTSGTASAATSTFSKSSSDRKIVISADSIIYNPALRVRTYSRELILSRRSAVSIKTKKGKRSKSNVVKIDTEGIILARNSTKIYYSDIKKLRVYHKRRWFPWLTLPTIIGPIWWHASSKVIESDAKKCKRQVVDLRVINNFNKFEFGKVKCFNK